jgi:peptidoglycan/xylan/chitin deacetylase (PgdA/CDA1 family)
MALRKSLFQSTGRVMRYAGAGVVARATAPSTNIRVSLSHYIRSGDLEQFRRIVSLLLSRRQPISPSQLFDFCTGAEPLQGEFLLMSFDDGLLSSFEATQAVLDPLGLKAMFFVPTAVLELEDPDDMRRFYREHVYTENRPLSSLQPEEYVAMAPEHLRALTAQGHAVLPHTHSHMRLSEITTPALIEQELVRPRRVLEDLLQVAAPAFAFPGGSERVVDSKSYVAVRETYSFCFTGLNGPNSGRTDPHFLHRDPIHGFATLDHAADVIDGCYDLYYRRKMRTLKRRALGQANGRGRTGRA